MHIYWHFYKTIFFVNIFLSVALVLLLGNISAYAILFATFGFLFSVGIVQFFESNSMYLYFNLGYSRFRLQSVGFLFNFGIAIVIHFLIRWLGYERFSIFSL